MKWKAVGEIKRNPILCEETDIFYEDKRRLEIYISVL